ncbi:MAG: hypothetical protein AAB530_02090 [Patescibacteria group bacterium]
MSELRLSEKKPEFENESIEETVKQIIILLSHDENVYALLKEASEKDEAKIKKLLADIKFLTKELNRRIDFIVAKETRH